MITEMKKLRFLKGLTLDDIYLKTKIDISRLSRIERQIFKPTDEEKNLIAKVLQVRINQLFSKDDD